MTFSEMETNDKTAIGQFPSLNSVQRAGSGRSKVALQPGHSLMDWIRLGNTGVDLTGVGGKVLKVTPEELAKHNKSNDAWMALKGKVYNVSRYLDYHPGGHDELFRGVGIDATDLFNEVHRWINFESMLKKCLVGRLVESTSKNSLQGTKSGLLPSSNSLLAPVPFLIPPSPIPKDPITSSCPRLDWFQNNEIVSVIIYTRNKSVNPSSTVINCPDGITFRASIFISSYVFLIHTELDHKIKPSYNVKGSADSGTIEIMLQKENTQLYWSSLGTPYPDHASFTRRKDSEMNYMSCSLLKKEPITHDTYLFTFKLPEGCRMTVPIGHHVHLCMQYEGCEINRSYTPVIPEIDTPTREITDAVYLMIKIYPNGALTPVINSISVGDYIDISEYDGTFKEEMLSKCTHLYLLAAGTGFTPMIKLINYCLYIATSNCRLVKLMFFNKTENDIMWKDQLSSLQTEFNEKFVVNHILSNASDEYKGDRGRISKELLEKFLTPKSEMCKSNNLIAICGPKGFNDAASKFVKELGYEEETIYIFQG